MVHVSDAKSNNIFNVTFIDAKYVYIRTKNGFL